MITAPKIVKATLHVFPGTTAREAVEFAIRTAQGMSMATVEFEFNGTIVAVDHHAKTDATLRKFFPELFRREG